jgi:predicted RNA-binding protein with PIN domain
MADATLYLFDGHNLLHAGPYATPRALADALAGFVAQAGARGVVVFDGAGEDTALGPLLVRYAADADALLERLAAEHRSRERVLLVSSDRAVVETAGREVARLSARTFLRDLAPPPSPGRPPGGLGDRLDPETRARLERLRRGR